MSAVQADKTGQGAIQMWKVGEDLYTLMGMEWALFCLGIILIVAVLAQGRSRVVVGGATGVILSAVVVGALVSGPSTPVDSGLPGTLEEEAGFASSNACRACHPAQYESWHDSYHRTMTQPAGEDTILADWEGGGLENRGFTTRLFKEGDAFWAELPDPLWHQDPSPDRVPVPPNIKARVVMTTGSHHMQNYWIRRPVEGVAYLDSFDNGALVQLPWVWMIDEQRWSPVQDSFLTPPSPHLEPPAVWNTSCHLCHSVAPEPRFDGEGFETQTAELGIACEACHGPGEAHAEANRSPFRRYSRRWFGDGEGDPTIVNPSRLDSKASTEVCGQCHSFTRVVDMPRWQKEGVPYRAGDELADSKALLLHESVPQNPHLIAQLEEEPNALVGRYWRDGTIRVAGREYNGLAESACFQEGDMSCLSCHSLHDYTEPADQLSVAGAGDGTCLDCHSAFRADPAAHTHHDLGSEGSRCQNCHMPHTTYGLFTAMRSHRIDSPSVANSKATGRPNACNLCHLDQSLAWADRYLTAWYGQAPAGLDREDQVESAAVGWLLRGDAAQRAITAWHMGWGPAQQASGKGWQGAHLAVLLADPYVSVRRVAQKSLDTLPGFESFEYDHLGSVTEQIASRDEAWGVWQKATSRYLDRRGPGLFIRPDGRIDGAAIQDQLNARDQTPLRIIE